MFQPFPKMARLSRECLITEKLDGTNAQVLILDASAEDFEDLKKNIEPLKMVRNVGRFLVFAGSRTRLITPEDDNYGFAGWVQRHAEELVQLGPGRHFGEWWGNGIQRKYGLKEKRFSLFNVTRWCLAGQEPQEIPSLDPRAPKKVQDVLPACVSLVPELYRGMFSTEAVDNCVESLRRNGSAAVHGWKTPEGVVVFHTAAGIGFKKTLENDETPKSLQ